MLVIHNRQGCFFGKKKTLESGASFVPTYHPIEIRDLGIFIRGPTSFLYNDEEVRKFYSPPPMVSYKSARKIKNYIMRSRLKER